MALEEAIAELTAAVKANTAALLKGGKASAADAAIEKVAADKVAKDKAPKVSIDKLVEAATTYLKGTSDADERKERTAHLKKIAGKHGAEKVSEIEGEAIGKALADINKLIAASSEPSSDDDGDNGSPI